MLPKTKEYHNLKECIGLLYQTPHYTRKKGNGFLELDPGGWTSKQ
jgi:hypothetical protein